MQLELVPGATDFDTMLYQTPGLRRLVSLVSFGLHAIITGVVVVSEPRRTAGAGPTTCTCLPASRPSPIRDR